LPAGAAPVPIGKTFFSSLSHANHRRPSSRSISRADRRPVSDATPAGGGGRFRRTLVSVLAVQIVTLLALWGLQARYTP